MEKSLVVILLLAETSNITERYTLISTMKTWAEARQYCREHHTDLVSIKSASENEEIKKKAPTSPFWIGLFNDPWKWTDGGNSTFQNWGVSEPNNVLGNENCVLMYSLNNGKWEDWPCSFEFCFICYEESNPTTKAPETTAEPSTETTERLTETQSSPEPGKGRWQVVRTEIKAPEGQDPEDPKIRDAILTELQERFSKDTPKEGMMLRWIKKDGKIFHKLEEKEEEKEETETCSKP
ncbi:macrophage mannose receptor 1-like isoform X2 [Polyodon spathula]|uniref:macrophage mannose receptor 1-like isoform X2 n=1 Tax=Polyodon spathula TaxID=7913 RepID=UPI001B7F1153|nr:macrophage mannose receptor 1-like isoform X2 [Polyodon spathula]